VNPEDDDLLMARLDRMLDRLEGGEEQAIVLGEAAYDWRTLDAELAELVADTAELAGAVRSGQQPRLISFEGEQISLELEFHPDRRLTGRVLPPEQAEVTLQSASAPPSTVQTDAHGGFGLDDSPEGAVSFVVRVADRAALQTPWLIL
jgi:hypothetical protein